jgi:hypothetical protein
MMSFGRASLLVLLSFLVVPIARVEAAVITITADASYVPVVCEGTGFVATGCSGSEIFEARVGGFAIRAVQGHFHRLNGLATFYPIDSEGIEIVALDPSQYGLFRVVSVTMALGMERHIELGDIRPVLGPGAGAQASIGATRLNSGLTALPPIGIGNGFNIHLGDVRFSPRFRGVIGDVPYTLVEFTVDTIPEPSATGLLAVAAVSGLWRWRRRR